MYGGLGMSVPSLHRESTDSLMHCTVESLTTQLLKAARIIVHVTVANRLLWTHLCLREECITTKEPCEHFCSPLYT